MLTLLKWDMLIKTLSRIDSAAINANQHTQTKNTFLMLSYDVGVVKKGLSNKNGCLCNMINPDATVIYPFIHWMSC